MPEIFIKKWVDYSSKYGVGFLLSDGKTSGLYCKDDTVICAKDDSLVY